MDEQAAGGWSASETEAQLQLLEQQTSHLQRSLHKLSTLLSARTSSNSAVTAAHTALSNQLSALVLQRDTAALQQSQRHFLRQMQLLADHLHALDALARGVATVNNTVVHVEKRAASRLSRARTEAAAHRNNK